MITEDQLNNNPVIVQQNNPGLMPRKKGISILTGILVIIVVALLGFGGVFAYQWYENSQIPATVEINPVACTMEAKQCPDGSSVGRTGPNCEFAQCPVITDWRNYINTEYGFQMTFPDSWQGYTVERSSWQGSLVDNSAQKYTGVMLTFKNPQTTAGQVWQDIPIMVITPDVWKLMVQEKITVSAAPIGPGEVGENANYIFAAPARWWGFTDAQGRHEAADIVTTFKAF